ncbi:MAG: M2 family metallopeptidase [Ignavibacteria bacterium]|nr:M2 family metallopeptidase [Ignavibacteria bacterium]
MFTSSCKKAEKTGETSEMEKKLTEFINKYVEKVKPLEKALNTAYFDASINSNEENWGKVAKLEKEYNTIFFNKDDFNTLKQIKESNAVKDPLLKRQLDILYNTYLSKQADTAKINRLTDMVSNIEQMYSKFRAKVGNKLLTDNDVEDILKNSTNNEELKKVWLAHKEIGPIVADSIIAVVKLRNEIARELGFKNYHEMSLKLSDQDPEEISRLFDELDNLTRDEFKKMKSEVDEFLAARVKIKPEQLMPWHYQNRFFQEAPQVFEIDFDKYFKDKDIVKLTQQYYASIGLPIDDIIVRSDLFEKPNKNQHAYCINIDRENDIRVLCNVRPNARWMETMLHEYGHALYEKHYAKDLPYLLRTPAHIFTTEAIAMLFGRKGAEAQWIQDMAGISDEEKTKIFDIANKRLKLQQLVFSRWSQVMYRFEKSMYENPDQDLNKLWWDLVEKYQMIKRPENRNSPDWATKIHIATSPCYYHNYHLGELFASQLYFTIAEKILKDDPFKVLSFTGHQEVGKFLIDKVFSVGAKFEWNDMIEKATGEKLTPKYYAKQFVH